MIKTDVLKKLILFVLFSALSVCGISNANAAEVNITIGCDKMGNIYTDKNVSFNITIQNNTGIAQPAEINVSAYTEKGKLEFSKDITETLNDSEIKTLTTEFKAEEFGRHILKVSAVCGGREYECSTRFSVINASGEMNEKIGLNSHYVVGRGLDKMEDLQKLYAEIGIKHTREGITWAHYEGTNGVYSLYNSHKRMLKTFRDNNQSNLLLLGHENLARNIIFPRTDEERIYWKLYVEKLCEDVKEYGIKDFEVWNEVDYYWTSGDDSRRINAEQYIKLLQTTYETVHSIIPDARVYAFALGDQSNIVFEEECLRYAVNNNIDPDELFDGISFHPYTSQSSPEKGMFLTRIEAQRDLMKKWNIADKSLIISEVGYTDAEGYISTDSQAAYVVRMSALARDRVDYTDWYVNLEKIDTTNEKEIHFGWMKGWKNQEINYEAKPVLIAMANYNRYMSGAVSDGDFKTSDGKGYIYKYRQKGKNVYMIWRTNGKESINLDIGAESAEIIDIYGNLHTQKTENGVLHLCVDENPQYIVGNFSKCDEVRNSGFETSETNIAYGITKTSHINITSLNKSDEYRVSAELPENVKVIENNGFKDGKAALVLDFSDFENSESLNPKVGIDVTNLNGDTVWKAEIPIKNADGQMNVSENSFEITGNVKAANADINILVMRPDSNELSQNPSDYIYINQVKSDSYGKYGFYFSDSQPIQGEYKVLLRVGDELSSNVYSYDVCIPKIVLTNGGNEVKSLDEISGRNLAAKLSVINIFDETLKGNVICAQYKDKKLKSVVTSNISADADNQSFYIPIEYLGAAEVDEIKIFLWSNNGMSPLIDKVTIN